MENLANQSRRMVWYSNFLLGDPMDGTFVTGGAVTTFVTWDVHIISEYWDSTFSQDKDAQTNIDDTWWGKTSTKWQARTSVWVLPVSPVSPRVVLPVSPPVVPPASPPVVPPVWLVALYRSPVARRQAATPISPYLLESPLAPWWAPMGPWVRMGPWPAGCPWVACTHQPERRRFECWVLGCYMRTIWTNLAAKRGQLKNLQAQYRG